MDGAELGVRVRRTHEHEPALARELQVVAIAPLAGEKALAFEPLLRARRAEARRRRIELDLQRLSAHLRQLAEREGFEPPVPDGYNRFRVCRIRPLCHLSAVEMILLGNALLAAHVA